MNITERLYWNARSYGNATKISKHTIRKIIIFMCIVTPFTNWLIPFIHQMIQDDFIYRYN